MVLDNLPKSVHRFNPQQMSRHLHFFVIHIVHISFQNPLSTIKSYFSNRGKVPKCANILSLRYSEKSWIIIFVPKYSQRAFMTLALSDYDTFCLHNPSFSHSHCNFLASWQVFLTPARPSPSSKMMESLRTKQGERNASLTCEIVSAVKY